MSNTGSKKTKNIVVNNLVLKISSVILAILLWLLVINIEDPQVTSAIKNVPVKILNESAITDNNEVYDILSGETVDIKITGPRTIVDALTRDDFTATADFKDLSKTNAVPINISINNTRYETKVTITEKSENTMRLSVRELTDRDYELSVKTNNNVQTGYVIYNMTPEMSSVTVTAPENVHERISRVAVVLNFTGKESADFEYRGDVLLYDNENKIIDQKSNHITVSDTNIMVDGTVYYKKTVNINYKVVDNLSDKKVMSDYEGSPQYVDIVGRKSVVEAIDEIAVPEELTAITDDKTELIIDLKTLLPDEVFIYNGDGIFKITADIEETITKTISVKASDIWLKKVPEGYEATIAETGNISLILIGLSVDLEDIDAEKLAPYVDMSGADEGVNPAKVKVILPDGAKLISDIEIKVKLEKEETPTDETTTVKPAETETTDDETSETTEENTTDEQEQDTTI